MREQRWVTWVFGCAVIAGCGAGASDAAGGGGTFGTFDAGGGSGFGGFGGGAGIAGSGGVGGAGGGSFSDAGDWVGPDGGVLPPLPPEVELRPDFELPRAGQQFVYAANPNGDTVAVIDSSTLRISIIEAGDQPTFLQTLAGTDNAIVLNVGSDDATVIRASDIEIKRSTVKVIPGANAISVVPDGKHAVVYYDSGYTNAGGTSGSFQDVTVVTIDESGTTDTAVSLTVGFRPSAVFHQADGTRSFVVTEDGVSILDYATIDASGAGIAPTIPLGVSQNGTFDVSVTADGNYALARATNTASLRLVDLRTRAITTLDLTDQILGANDADAGAPTGAPLEVTDLDLAPNGDTAFAVVRNHGAVLALPIPEAFTDPTSISVIDVPGQVIGSITVADDGRRVLAYTTAYDLAEAVTIIDLRDLTAAPVTVALRKAVQAIAIAPDGESALVIHKKADGDPNQIGIDPDLAIDRSYGYSVVSLANGFAKLQITPTEVGPFTIVPDGSYLFLLFNTNGARLVQRVSLRTFLVDSIPLGSRPVSVGSVAASHKVFVSQEHPDGRITLIDWLTAATESVTGFELNSRIRQ